LKHFILLSSLLCIGCNRHQFPTTVIQVDGHPMTVEVAATKDRRAQGMMFRDSLPRNEGILFVYPDEQPRSFWMKNTRVPLSIAYVDAMGTITQLEDLTPLSTKSVKSTGAVTYALEVNRGWFVQNDVEVGDFLTDLPDLPAQ